MTLHKRTVAGLIIFLNAVLSGDSALALSQSAAPAPGWLVPLLCLALLALNAVLFYRFRRFDEGSAGPPAGFPVIATIILGIVYIGGALCGILMVILGRLALPALAGIAFSGFVAGWLFRSVLRRFRVS